MPSSGPDVLLRVERRDRLAAQRGEQRVALRGALETLAKPALGVGHGTRLDSHREQSRWRTTTEPGRGSCVSTLMKRTLAISAAVLAAIAAPSAFGAPTPQTLTLGASATTVKFGATVTLSGKLAGGKHRPKERDRARGSVPCRRVWERRQRHHERDRRLVVGREPVREHALSGPLREGRQPYPRRDGAPRHHAEAERPHAEARPARALLGNALPRARRRGDRATAAYRRVGGAPSPGPCLRTWRRPRAPRMRAALRVRRDGTYRARFLGDADHVAGNSRARRATVH